MRVLFWGTPDFAVPSLRALLGEGHEVVGVVTQPDRPAGRGRALRPSPVRVVAEEEGLPVLTPDRPRGEPFLESVRGLAPRISVVVAYGHILLPEVLALPELGSVNVHASLLPELRGAAPINWAIIRGIETTGITVMRMTAGMDEGPILLQRPLPIGAEETASTLRLSLAELGAEAIVEALGFLEGAGIEAREQDPARATYAPKIDRETARIDWTRPAAEVARFLRGMDRIPGAWTTLDGAPIKLFRPSIVSESGAAGGVAGMGVAEPGVVLRADPETGLVVRCGEGAVRVAEVHPAGKRIMGAEAWLRGGGVKTGDRFL